MRLFLYGTLLDAATLARHSGDPNLPARRVPATLHGWRRVALPHAGWPTLRRDRAGVVTGAVVNVTAAAGEAARGLRRRHLSPAAGCRGDRERQDCRPHLDRAGRHAPPMEGISHAASATRPTRHARGRDRHAGVADRPRCVRGQSRPHGRVAGAHRREAARARQDAQIAGDRQIADGARRGRPMRAEGGRGRGARLGRHPRHPGEQ